MERGAGDESRRGETRWSRLRRALRVVWTGRARELGDDPVGRAGERAAAAYLKRRGYRILGRNVRLRFGEGDLLALAPDGVTTVLVEVKSRRMEEGGSPLPEVSVTRSKREKLRLVARALKRANRWDGRPMRIDVVGVEFRDGERAVVRHAANAVDFGRW